MGNRSSNMSVGSNLVRISNNSRMITLKSSDGKTFEVDEVVAIESEIIKEMIGDDLAYSEIPLLNVTGKILAKVIEYCTKHVEAQQNGDDTKGWDSEFVKVDQETLFDLILAANYLNIKGLLDLTCQTVADFINRQTAEEMRRIFNIKNSFTPEEEEELRRENSWDYESMSD